MDRFENVTTRQLCYLLKDAKKFTGEGYPSWRQQAAQEDCIAIEAECERRDAELARLRAVLALAEPVLDKAVAYWQDGKPGYPVRADPLGELCTAANDYAYHVQGEQGGIA